MTTLPPLEVAMSNKDYYQITINIFQRYVNKHFESKFLWRSIKIDFKNWTKENYDILNGKTWNKISRFYIPRIVWIEDYNNQYEVLMNLISTPKYDIDLKDWDMDCIKEVGKTYSKVSRSIHL